MSTADELVPILKKLRLSGVLTLDLRTKEAVDASLSHTEFLFRLCSDEVERRRSFDLGPASALGLLPSRALPSDQASRSCHQPGFGINPARSPITGWIRFNRTERTVFPAPMNRSCTRPQSTPCCLSNWSWVDPLEPNWGGSVYPSLDKGFLIKR